MEILLAYILAIIVSPKSAFIDHIFYLVSMGSNYLIFCLSYNYTIDSNDNLYISKLFVWLNLLVILYCALQLIVGFNEYAFLGIKELSIHENRESGQRLTGPFRSVGLTAEYLALQICFIGFLSLYNKKKYVKILLYSMMTINFGLLVSTGNRGGFITLIIGTLLFFYCFRNTINIFI